MSARPATRLATRSSAWLLIAALVLSGCGTINSYAGGCPAPYSGVRTDREYLRHPGDALRWVMLAWDVPLSAIIDTVTLPLGASLKQPPPTPVSPGCRWAIPRR